MPEGTRMNYSGLGLILESLLQVQGADVGLHADVLLLWLHVRGTSPSGVPHLQENAAP